MKRAWLTALVLCAACDNLSTPPPAAMPWLHGFNAVVTSDTPTPQAARWLSDALATATDDDYGALELRADLVGDARTETVLASHRLGIAVIDPAGRLVARAPAFETGGSADDLIALAAGDGPLGSPLIVAAVQIGGHRENAIWIALYRMAGPRELRPLFYAPIETREGPETRAGALTFTRSGLLYRAPDTSAATSWTFDLRRGRYIERTSTSDKPTQPGIW